MKYSLVALLPMAVAWPTVMQMNADLQRREAEAGATLEKRAVTPPYRAPLFLSKRPNTGQSHIPPAPFDKASQTVNVKPGSGHEWKPPTSTDLRGECPGLNAAANHNFLPRNGKPTILQTITGLGEAYNMSPDLAGFLAVVSVALSGDPVTQQWSIGGAFPNTLPYPASGILGLHSRYEGDASIIRGDAYLEGGNVGVFKNFKWEHLVNLPGETFDLDKAAAQSDWNTRWSILNNPYYFSAPFAGLVAPAAYDFVINFMSNHSEEVPGGTLTYENLATFFSVTGTRGGSFKHNPGLERIPDNWYKRPTLQQYNAVDVFTDLFANNAMYPGILRFGGNTGKTNSFAGVALGPDAAQDLFNLGSLKNGNAGACFLYQAAAAVLPDAATPLVGLGETLFSWFSKQIGGYSSALGCPQLKQIDSKQLYAQYFKNVPGANYDGNNGGPY